VLAERPRGMRRHIWQHEYVDVVSTFCSMSTDISSMSANSCKDAQTRGDARRKAQRQEMLTRYALHSFFFGTALDSSADAHDTHIVVVKVRRSEVRAERRSGKKC